MKELIGKALKLWDPYDLRIFPKDEYDDYARNICRFINITNDLTIEKLTSFVYNLLKSGLKLIDGNNYVEIEKLDKVSTERFAELIFLYNEKISTTK